MKLLSLLKEITSEWEKEVNDLLDKKNKFGGKLSPAEQERLNQLSKVSEKDYVPLNKRVHDWLSEKYYDLSSQVDTSQSHLTEHFYIELPSGEKKIVFSIIENTDKNMVTLEMSQSLVYAPIAVLFNISRLNQVKDIFENWVVSKYGGSYDKVDIFYDNLDAETEKFVRTYLGVKL